MIIFFKGKTTISRLLFRFYDVSGGSVKVNGVDVKQLTQKSLRKAIGVVPQSTSMFNDTLQENVVRERSIFLLQQNHFSSPSNQDSFQRFLVTLKEIWQEGCDDGGT